MSIGYKVGFTKEWLKDNLHVIKCISHEEAAKISEIYGGENNFIPKNERMYFFGDRFFSTDDAEISNTDYYPAADIIEAFEEEVLKTKSTETVISDPDIPSIIGYTYPFDTVFGKKVDNKLLVNKGKDKYEVQGYWIPAEIVETWDPVYQKNDPTREEITAQWVMDNEVKIGDRAMILKGGDFGEVVAIGTVFISVRIPGSSTRIEYPEAIKKVTKHIEKFSFEDRELFRDKWVTNKGCSPEFKIIAIDSQGVVLGYVDKTCHKTYEEMMKYFEFIDGKPFGKEVWI